MTHVRDLFDLTGKVALVTGGSRGLGLEMAHGLGEAGATVTIAGRRAQWLETAEVELREAGITCEAMVCDVADAAAVEALVEGMVPIRRHFSPGRHLLPAADYRTILAERYAGWDELTGVAA